MRSLAKRPVPQSSSAMPVIAPVGRCHSARASTTPARERCDPDSPGSGARSVSRLKTPVPERRRRAPRPGGPRGPRPAGGGGGGCGPASAGGRGPERLPLEDTRAGKAQARAATWRHEVVAAVPLVGEHRVLEIGRAGGPARLHHPFLLESRLDALAGAAAGSGG